MDNGRERFLKALGGQGGVAPVAVTPTSVATTSLMEETKAFFPEAHRDPELMARLAETGHTVAGFASIMPIFSVVHESAALGCQIDWGDRGNMPAVRSCIYRKPEDIRIAPEFLKRPEITCVLDALRILKKKHGSTAAIIGKIMGPWTLAYHTFGVQEFLMLTIDQPVVAGRVLDQLLEISILFGRAQVAAGADALTVGDHITGDLVAPHYYRDFLLQRHEELNAAIKCPLILHICGKTVDRMPDIAQSGMAAFHFDSMNDPAKALAAVGDWITLVGNVSTTTLLRGAPEQVAAETRQALDAGIACIAPACAIPLATPVDNLRAIVETCAEYEPGTRAKG